MTGPRITLGARLRGICSSSRLSSVVPKADRSSELPNPDRLLVLSLGSVHSSLPVMQSALTTCKDAANQQETKKSADLSSV